MKLLAHFVGLLFVGFAAADISLKLKEQQQQQQSQYLPPISENTARNEQQKFEESKYGNSKYQVFEVHNGYNGPAGNSGSSSGRSQKIRIEHINAPPGFPLDDPNLDATLLRIVTDGAAENHGPRVEENEVVSNNEQIPIPFPSNYRHVFPEKSSSRKSNYNEDQKQQQLQQTTFVNSYTTQERAPQAKPFKGSPYLPPVPGSGENVGPEYLPPQTDSENRPFKGPDYLPPSEGQVPTFQPNNPFKGPDYLPPQPSGSTTQQYKAPEYLPPTGGATNQGSYQDNLSNNQQYNVPAGAGTNQNTYQTNGQFKGPDYLPPPPSVNGGGVSNQGSYQSNTPFKGPDYLPPSPGSSGPATSQGSYQTSSQPQTGGQSFPNNPFKGPDYLPPPSSNNFKGPEYLPPQASAGQQSVTQNTFTAVGALPPGYDFVKPENSEAAISELHTLPNDDDDNGAGNNSQEVTVQAHLQVAGGQVQSRNLGQTAGSYQAPGYLPPVAGQQQSSNIVYGTPKPGNAPLSPAYQAPGYLPPPSQQQTTTTTQGLGSYQAPGYLPPSSTPQPQGGSYQAPGYLPPSPSGPSSTNQGNVYQAPGYLPPPPSQGQSERESKSYSAPGYLPPGYDFQKPVEQTTNQAPSQTNIPGNNNNYKAPGYLPPGYDFQKPAETEVHQGSSPQSQSGGHNHNYQAPGYLPPASQTPFKGPEYLPPVTNAGAHEQSSAQLPSNTVSQVSTSGLQTASLVAPNPANINFKSPAYLPPVSNAPRPSYALPSTYQGPGYLPPFANAHPTPTAAQTSHMHPLSSYMTSVQPFERYGSARKPFAEYGPPPAAVATNTHDVAPMYKEAASRPQYYAPAMSYAQNTIGTQAYGQTASHSFASSTFNHQTRQALQAFMPKDLRQEIPSSRSLVGTAISSSTTSPTVSVAPTASAKIRTVQIVNPNTVKTLKVLESLDHSGVKTIKILGPSNEEPKGEHRVVKVVSGREQTVQTVKIYNDHQDVTDSHVAESHGYLPPRRKRNHKKVTAKGRRRIVKN
ncbi:trithorax group protein osa [Musca domestica]|uniref:Trithorax group protein osa n=1 Tax=Musca domestica TaxID=7370 RepID=A0A1I8MBL0_MUSDO|nr:trithorax group protein osa [Musca domestica]